MLKRTFSSAPKEEKVAATEATTYFLQAAAKKDVPGCLQWLKNGANIDEKFGEFATDQNDSSAFCGPNDTALISAVKRGNIELVEMLLARGANTEILNGNGETALMIAAFHAPLSGDKYIPLVKLLLSYDANPNTQGLCLLTAMDCLFLGLRSWHLENQKGSLEKTFHLLNEKFSGDLVQIPTTLKARGYEDSIIRLCKSILLSLEEGKANKTPSPNKTPSQAYQQLLKEFGLFRRYERTLVQENLCNNPVIQKVYQQNLLPLFSNKPDDTSEPMMELQESNSFQ